jgi:hypothetical protein
MEHGSAPSELANLAKHYVELHEKGARGQPKDYNYSQVFGSVQDDDVASSVLDQYPPPPHVSVQGKSFFDIEEEISHD